MRAKLTFLKLPFLASGCAAFGQFIWLVSTSGPDECSVIGDRMPVLWGLVAAGAIGEACAAAARGSGWTSRVLWLMGSAVILFGWAFLMWLLAIDAGKCFD